MIKLMKIDLQLSVPGPFALVEMTNALDKARLDTGQTSAPTWQAVHVNIEDDRESPPGLTDLILTVPFTMASKRLVELFELFNCDCEYLPLVVHYHDQTLEGEYFALNALHVVHEAIDLEQSKIGYYDAEFHLAEDIEKLVLKPEALGEAPLCYLSEISHYAVSDELAAAIAAAGLIGIELMEPTKFSSC